MGVHETLDSWDRFADRLLKKHNENKPLQALFSTTEHEKFDSAIAGAIRKQAAAGGALIKGYDLAVVDSPDKLGQMLQNDMPRLDEFLPASKVEKYLLFAFEFTARLRYIGMGLTVKKAADDEFDFQLTNERYISEIKNQADYLLHRSSIDETTRSRLIDIVSTNRLEGKTIDEVAGIIDDEFDDISDKRAFVIARTEACSVAGRANYAVMKENGVPTKRWVCAGPNPCDTCLGNQDDGDIPIDQPFSSGDMYEPSHPNDECYTEGGEIDLESIDPWDGS